MVWEGDYKIPGSIFFAVVTKALGFGIRRAARVQFFAYSYIITLVRTLGCLGHGETIKVF